MKKKKVFLGLVNYGTQAGYLSQALREKGVKALSVGYPDRYKRQIDVMLDYEGKGISRIVKRVYNFFYKIYLFFSYDIFHFFAGTTLVKNQFDLRFYKFFGKRVIIEYLGSDIQQYQYSHNKYKWNNITHMMNEKEGLIHDKKITNRYNFEKNYLDKQLVCSPSYSEFAPGSSVLPLAINLETFKMKPFPKMIDGKIVILHAPTNKRFKGTKFIVNAVEKLQLEGHNIEFRLLEGVTHMELLENYSSCHIFIDQILHGWYGTASIEAMAVGRPVVCFLREEYYKYYTPNVKVPILSANPDTIYKKLNKAIDYSYEELKNIGIESREYVEQVHSHDKVSDRLINYYKEL